VIIATRQLLATVINSEDRFSIARAASRAQLRRSFWFVVRCRRSAVLWERSNIRDSAKPAGSVISARNRVRKVLVAPRYSLWPIPS